MAVTLNASTSAGAVITPDTSGVLALQTAGTTAVTVDASQNVGIGTASPTTKLDVSGGFLRLNEDGAGTKIITVRSNFASVGPAINVTTNDPLLLMTNNTERARFNAGAPILCLSGGSTTATGTGIAFPATQSASTDANTLDDYEEGTFTPVMNFGGAAAFSSGTAQGKYTKIGNVVNFQINFTGYVKTVNTGTSQITGMPFSASDLQKIYMVQGDSLTYTSGAFLFCFNAGAGATLDPYQQAAGTASQFTNSSFNNGGSFRVTGSYFIS